jgi:hypothetical protein
MKHFVIAALTLGMAVSVQAAKVQTSLGIGAVVPDRDNVEAAVVGKADTSYNLSRFLSIGLSVGQTGGFKQDSVPQNVAFANSNPQAFAGKKYQDHHGDTIIIEGDTTIINITDAPDKLPSRPSDTTERSMWMAEPYLKVGFPIDFRLMPMSWGSEPELSVKPYFVAFLGGSGVTTYDGQSRIGTSKGLGGGIEIDTILGLGLGFQSLRRHILTNADSYGNWEHTARVIFSF